MKNYQTPRTLAECEFTTGYGIATPAVSGSRWWHVVGTVLAFALIGVMLAWRG